MFAKICTVLLVCLCLVLAGCSVSTLVTTLDIVAASTAAASTIVASGGTGNSRASIVAYLSGVSTASSSAATELQSSDSSAVKYTKIAAAFAVVATISLDATASAEVKAAISTVETAVQLFLTALGKTKTAALSRSGTGGANIQITAGDRRVLRGTPAKLAPVRANLEAAR